MKRFTDDDIEALLGSEGSVAPPESLLERIQEQIPASLEVPPARTRSMTPWLAAAAVLTVSLLSVLLFHRTDAPLPPMVEVVPPAPPSPAEEASAAKPPVVAVPPTFPPGEVRAIVTDRTGAVLPGVRVTVSGEGSTPDTNAVTDNSGVARFQGLLEGEVQLRAELPGFVPQHATALLSSRADMEVSMTLHLAGVEESVTITAEAPRIDVASSAIGSSLTEPALGPDRYFAFSLDQFAPSTGGTREPNDAVYDRVYFQHYGVHPFVDTEDDPLSTFGLDVDTASYSVARRFIEDGNLPNPDSVRVEEFVNSFDYDDPPPAKGDFAIRVEGAPTPFTGTARTRLLRIGIRAREEDRSSRLPMILTFLVDVSGSMAREDRLGLVKKGLGFLLGELGPEDRVGLVVFGTTARAVLEPVSDRDAIRRAVDALTSEGSTNLEAGLDLAYQMAGRSAAQGAVSRVILCSDGVANEGRTGWESLVDLVSRRREGIALTAIGFGMGNYNDVLMEQLANHGDGNYAYVDDIHEARRVFVHRLTSLVHTVGRDAKIQVAFNPKVVESYRLLGYENRSLKDEDFTDDAKDAGEIGLGHRVSALYEVKLAPEAPENAVLGSVRLRYHSVAKREAQELEQPMKLADVASSWEAAPASLRLAAIVAELAEVLRGSYWAEEGSLEQVLVEARRLLPELSDRQEVVELLTLVGKAVELR